MFFLFIACAPPDADPGLILMGPEALDAGGRLEIDGQDFSSSLPVLGYADEEIWVSLPQGEELQLQPESGELIQVWLEEDELLYERALIGEEIDPDAALILGERAAALAMELGLEGEVDPEGTWLREPDLLLLLTDPALPQVEAIVPLQAALQGASGLMLETGNVASRAGGARRGSGTQGSERVRGRGSAAGSALTQGAVGDEAGVLALDAAAGAQALSLSPQELALVGFYEDSDRTRYTLAMDGSLRIISRGQVLSGWFTMDPAGTVHFYLAGEGPVVSLQVVEQGRLRAPGLMLTRIEDLIEP